jgi:heme exporter protein CcmD
MSGHWPYIIAAYTICFSMLAIDWFASSFELKKMRRDVQMRQRRDEKSVRRDERSTEKSKEVSNE